MRIHGAVDNDIHPPRAGGTQRSFGLFRGLARRHEVDALCVVPYRNRAPREAEAAGVRLHRRRAWYTAAAWRLEQWRLAPLAAAAYGHRMRAAHWLAALPGTPDVLCVGAWFGGMLEASRAPLRVYLSQNVESDHFRMTAPQVLARHGWVRRVREFEARVVGHADRIVVCSDEDAARMRALHGLDASRVVVTPNGYDETVLRAPTPAERTAARAAMGFGENDHVGLFLGSDAAPNREALEWLVRRAMPRLANDGFKLLVVGGVSAALRGRRESWLRAMPAVDDPLPLMHAADAGLNPVTGGGGSNVKVPGYLAAGLSVVTTPFGMRGYAPLASLVSSAAIGSFVEAWAARPRGWALERTQAPAELGAYAWGDLGARLGEALEQSLPAVAAARAATAARSRATHAPGKGDGAGTGEGAGDAAVRRAWA